MEQQGAAVSHRRFDRDSFRRDRAPNGVAWRFPAWTAVGFAFPSPFLGSAPLGIPLPEHSRLIGLDLALIGRLSLRETQITGGDSNPDCQSAFFSPVLRVTLSLAADFRRARNCLLCTVFRIWKAGLSCQERSPISPVTFWDSSPLELAPPSPGIRHVASETRRPGQARSA